MVSGNKSPEQERTRGKTVSESRKRSLQDSSRGKKALKIGGPSNIPSTTRVLRSRQVETIFTNREFSPVEVDEKDEAIQDTVNRVFSSGREIVLGGGSSSKKPAEPGTSGNANPMHVGLKKVAAKIISFMDLRLEDLAENDLFKVELIVATSALDETLPIQIRVLEGWKLVCAKAVDCSDCISKVKPVIEEGKKSEQEMLLKIENLEKELAVAKAGFAKIRSTNDRLTTRLERYESINASMVLTLERTDLELKEARKAYAAAEKDVEALDKKRTMLKSSLLEIMS
ncbi:hypothetical protein PIB30_024138 [Stylosanthes scabra]|uniref:Uncharacterized protein n=1 Tax=Stylosanthes scabra TaxID=79078 RepID=A0ABU6X7W3_9FABA|nr:hypothetical protein [Stylosanthes scabra]